MQLESLLYRCLTLLLLATLPDAASAQPLQVPEGQVLSVRLNSPANTVAIGDVEIADARVAFEEVIVVVAKTAGVTNVIAYDAEGSEIFSNQLIVTSVEGSRRVDLMGGGRRRIHICSTTHCDEQREPDQVHRSESSTDVNGDTQISRTTETFD